MSKQHLEDIWFMAREAKRANSPMVQPLSRILAGTATANDRHNVAHMVRCERIRSELKGVDASYDVAFEAAILAA